MKKYILLVVVLFAFARPAYGMTNQEILNAIIILQRQIAVLQSQLNLLKANQIPMADNKPNVENVDLIKSTTPKPKFSPQPPKKLDTSAKSKVTPQQPTQP